MYQDSPFGRARVSAAFSSTEHLATEAVVAYVDGELTMAAHQRAAAHLSLCAECAGEVDAQQRVRTAVRSAAPLAMPAELRGMLSRIPDNRAESPNDHVSRGPFVPGAIVVGAGGGFYSVLRPLAPQPSGPEAVGAPPPAATSRSGLPRRLRRSFPLGVVAASALAAGVLAGAAAAPDGGRPVADTPAGAAVAPAERGAAVLPASNAPHAQLASFDVMFDGLAGPPTWRR